MIKLVPFCRRVLRSMMPALALAVLAWCAEPESAGTGDTDRKIDAQDILNIYIVGEKDLPFEYRVTSTGTIQFPFLETVDVKGKTPSQVAAELRESLGKDYFVDPQVIVAVKQYRKQYVRVIGFVFKPGMIDLPSEQKFDIVDAIAAAGGLNNLGDKDKITLTRKGKSEKHSLTKLKAITDPAKKIWLEADDIIEVGQSVF